jgi:hypothetical protein
VDTDSEPDGGDDDGLFQVDRGLSRVGIQGVSSHSLTPPAVFPNTSFLLPVPNVHGEILRSPIAYNVFVLLALRHIAYSLLFLVFQWWHIISC